MNRNNLKNTGYCVYRWLSLDTGRTLVGYSGDLPNRIRFYLEDAFGNRKMTASGFYDDLRRFGLHRFIITIVQDDLTQSQAMDLELRLIADGVNRGENLYNCEGTTRFGYPPHGRSNPYITTAPAAKGSWPTTRGRRRGPHLTSAQRSDLRRMHKQGATPTALSRVFGISVSGVCRAVKR